jgi:hypothetical protein
MKKTVADGVSENFALRHKNGTSSQNMPQVLTTLNQLIFAALGGCECVLLGKRRKMSANSWVAVI